MALPREYTTESCPIARSLEIVGERWTMLVVRDAFYGVRRFSDFRAHLGIPKAVLSERLSLLVDEGVLARTPATQLRERTARLQIGIDESGAANYAYRVEDAGYTAELERNTFRRATHQRTQQIAANRLLLTGLHGSAQLHTSDVAATDGPFSTSMQGTVEHFVWTDGTTAVSALTSLSGGMAGQVQAWLAEPARTQPWACIGGEFDETLEMTLPAFVRVTDVPPDATVKDRFVEFSSRYVFDPAARVLQVTRHLRAAFGHQMCSADEFADVKDDLVRIERDLDAEVVVKVVK